MMILEAPFTFTILFLQKDVFCHTETSTFIMCHLDSSLLIEGTEAEVLMKT